MDASGLEKLVLKEMAKEMNHMKKEMMRSTIWQPDDQESSVTERLGRAGGRER